MRFGYNANRILSRFPIPQGSDVLRMHHSANPVEVESETLIRKRQRIGIWLMLLFSLAYGGFIGLCTFANSWFSQTMIGGIPLTVVYGVGLILLSILTAMLYGWLSRSR